MQVLIIPDSFKGSLTAKEVATIMERAVKNVFPKSNCVAMPFSDGGEGALTVLQAQTKGNLVYCDASDALHRPVKAPYFVFDDQKSAWIELSQTAGLTMLDKKELNPLVASTWGTGKMIENALDRGCRKIYLGIGGSATQDLGTGIVAALGGRFLDETGEKLPLGGGELHRLHKIDLSPLNPKVLESEWIVACDVQNPLLGEFGTAHTYAKQKGATQEDIAKLELGGSQFAKVVSKEFGLDVRKLEGGGAAGGVSAGLYALFNAQLKKGFDLLAQKTGLKTMLSKFDLVLTGEGTFDEQSLFGKLPIQVASLAKNQGTPTLILAGRTKINSLSDFPNCKIITTSPPTSSVEQAILNAERNLYNALTKELQLIKTQPL